MNEKLSFHENCALLSIPNEEKLRMGEKHDEKLSQITAIFIPEFPDIGWHSIWGIETHIMHDC